MNNQPSLRTLLAQAGWSDADLARAVNRVGIEAGLRLRYGRASVAQWAVGVVPRPPVPGLIAEALSRRLGRRVTPPQALPGLADQPADDQPGWPDADLTTRLRSLAVASRPGAARNLVFCQAELSVPDWQTALGMAVAPPQAASPRVGPAELESAATALRIYSDVDIACGGGLVRIAALEYLTVTIAEWLRAPASPAVRQHLLSLASQWAYLCAFLCFDDELHGLAQRCYRMALQLAATARDTGAYATTLRAMSVQAHHLGHSNQALQLAEAAVDTGHADPSTAAFLHGQLAVALAATGDRTRAVAALHRAERGLDQVSDARPIGRYHHAALAHQRAAVCQSLGDRRGAIAALTDSIAGRPAHERRAHAVTLAWLAELQLDHGHLEEALTTWQHFGNLCPSLHSGRVRTALAELCARVRPYRRNRSVARLLHWVSRLQPGRSR